MVIGIARIGLPERARTVIGPHTQHFGRKAPKWREKQRMLNVC
jgi:hypothetical protein